MQKVKKILIYAGGGIGGLFVLLIVASMFVDTSELPGMDQEEGLRDARLEELRQREAELQDVFEGEGDGVFINPDSDEDPFAEVGVLSDFDELNADTPPQVNNSAAQPAEVGENEFADMGDPDFPSEPEDPYAFEEDGDSFADSDALNDTAAFTPATPAASEPEDRLRSDVMEEIHSLEERLKDQLRNLEVLVGQIDTAPDTTTVEGLMNTLTDDIAALRDSQERIAAQSNSTHAELTALAAKVESLENAQAQRQQTQRSQAQTPSADRLRNLYHLERIEGGTARLVGQNTGRHYIVAAGDTLAYGGRVASIRGDRVTLQWPTVTTTLSVY